MGSCVSTPGYDFVVKVTTGDKKGAGTNANIKIVLYDVNGAKTTPYDLNHLFRNDNERGCVDRYEINLDETTKTLQLVDKIEIWRDDGGEESDWYVEKITIEDARLNAMSVFPVFRWIKGNQQCYIVKHLDTSLPQHDDQKDQRRAELVEKQQQYVLVQKAPGIPCQVDVMPEDEEFTSDYMWDLQKKRLEMFIPGVVAKLSEGSWDSIDDIVCAYKTFNMAKPACIPNWKDDWYFGLQRVARLNNELLHLCTSLPDKLKVTDEELSDYLEGLTIQEAIDNKRLFVIDLAILEGIKLGEGRNLVLCSPIALFFESKTSRLLPVAIQLFQEKEDNPVFLPNDPAWLQAKMWFNNAEAAHHESVTHLAMTHLLMEGVIVCTHRQLSQSHPIFKLLAPHFLFTIAKDARGLNMLLEAGTGYFDKCTTVGREGTIQLIAKAMGDWTLDISGTLPENLRNRGLLDNLSYFPIRDDAMLYYEAIRDYVAKIVGLYYGRPDTIAEDYELQAWREELTKDREQNGVGLQGVPGEDGKFTTKEQIITTLTSIIYTCSVAHAITNFPQYNEYGFPPNYPSMLRGVPPTDKNEDYSEEQLMALIPDIATSIEIMAITSILVEKPTLPLGQFETNYTFDPTAVRFVSQFRAELNRIAGEIKMRNGTRHPKYEYLLPNVVPNSISA